MTATRIRISTSGPKAGHVRPALAAPRARSTMLTRAPLSRAQLLDLQRDAGNRAVTGLVRSLQRVGGWSDADTAPGTDLAAGEAKTGWNTGEHAVGSIRRIPIDGLVSGLQKRSGSDGGKALTNEEVAGTVTGPARSDAAEQKGRGRAIALVSSAMNSDLPVDVLFHLHGNTENAKRGFSGWRQHKASGKVRDVERDRIAQQMESAGSPQLVGILPMGLNQSNFGAISPDSYIRDAFDRLAELGAWKRAPKDFRVVLSAHSGGGFTVEKMLRGRAGYDLPKKLGMIILFEANNAVKDLKKGQVQAFQGWAIGQLDAHLAYLSSTSHSAADKTAYLKDATRLRAFFDPGGSYVGMYGGLRTAIANWFTDNGAKLGSFRPEVEGLLQVIEQKVGHEGHMRAGLGSALADLPGAPSGKSGKPAPAPGPATPTPTAAGAATTLSLAAREAAITPAMVAAQGGSGGKAAALAFRAGPAGGMPPLAAAAGALAAAGLRAETDLTDALFALVHPDLHGGRIPAERNDLKREWRQLRSAYTRPAVSAGGTSKAAGTSTGGRDTTPAGAPTPSGPTAVGPTTPAPPTGAKTTGTPEEEYESFSANVKKAFGKNGVKRYLAVRELYRTRKETAGNPAEWLNQLQFGASFCGTKLDGVHPKLLSVLNGIDKECTKLAAAVRNAGAPVVFQGQFQPRAVTDKPDKLSDHALGLALHLNYANNPYVGRNEPSSKLIARIAAEAGQKDFWSSVKGSGRKTTQARVEEIYHSWAGASDAVAKYFHEMEAMDVKNKAGELDAAGQAELKKRTAEYWKLRNTDLAKHRDPKNGVFMHTTSVEGDPMLQIIKQLTSVAGLEWGGTYASRPKDLHHFALKG